MLGVSSSAMPTGALLANGIIADDQQFLNVSGIQWQYVIFVFKQGDRIFGHLERDGGMFRRFVSPFFAVVVIADKFGFRHHIQHAAHFVVEHRLGDGSVLHRIQQRLFKVADVCAHVHLQVCAAQRAFHGVVQAVPVGHH